MKLLLLAFATTLLGADDVPSWVRDAAAANQALALLIKELDHLAAEEPAENTNLPAVQRNPQLAEAMQRFQDRAAQVLSERR